MKICNILVNYVEYKKRIKRIKNKGKLFYLLFVFILKRLFLDVGVKEVVIMWLFLILWFVQDIWNIEDLSGVFLDIMMLDIKGRLIMIGVEFNVRDNLNMREISFN